jgi:hypothetical protein
LARPFHGIAAFTNSGFSPYSDSLVGFAADPVVLGPIMAAVILGGIGFPALHDIRRNPRRAAKWSLHTKMTLFGTGLLFAGGTAAVLAYEWGNPATLGPAGPAGKLLGAAFHSAMTRSGGFNALDIGQMRPETLAVSYVLMMVGGGSASTAGGIKVTTFLVLGFVVWAEIRGEPDVTAFGRRISREVQRQALTIALLAVGFVGMATVVLLSVTDLDLDDALFETVSAFATVGLSTGVTADLGPAGHAVLVVLMFSGGSGPSPSRPASRCAAGRGRTAIRRSAPSLARAPAPRSDSVAVIGLGRFGGAVAESLVRLGHDVLGIDEDAELVQSWADRLTHVVQADTTDGGTLRRLGVQEFAHAVVGIGGDIEASVLTVLALSELGVEDIWAKALGEKHGTHPGAHRRPPRGLSRGRDGRARRPFGDGQDDRLHRVRRRLRHRQDARAARGGGQDARRVRAAQQVWRHRWSG